MHTCRGCSTLNRRERTWHGLYRRWDHAALNGNKIRAAIYGRVADAWARTIWP